MDAWCMYVRSNMWHRNSNNNNKKRDSKAIMAIYRLGGKMTVWFHKDDGRFCLWLCSSQIRSLFCRVFAYSIEWKLSTAIIVSRMQWTNEK